MKLVVQPDQGIEPIDLVVFRLDVKEIVKALANAVTRGVAVSALIAHTNKGGEKSLRKLETRLLEIGVTVSRSADDLVRYHGKMMIVDGKHVYVLGHNLTWMDMEKSRSFGVISTQAAVVRDAMKLYRADCDRQPYGAASDRLVVSPENSRTRLADLIKGARRQLLIYDPNISDLRMVRLIDERAAAGVDVRIIGKVMARSKLKAQKLADGWLHVRAIMRDGQRAFLGSQSLRTMELDRRREIGILIRERAVVQQMVAVFEQDWAKTKAAREAAMAAAGSLAAEAVSAGVPA
jgi:phosphatidylserine/phosphatidylglycerophosphate/cardiolipin synthase-like enzyme